METQKNYEQLLRNILMITMLKFYKLRGSIEIVFQDQDYIDVLEVQPIEDGK